MTDVDMEVGFDFGAKFDAAVGRLEQRITSEFMRAEQRRMALLPNAITMEGLLNPATGQNAIWDFGTPQAGRKWEMRLWSLDSYPDGANTSNFLLLVGVPVAGAQLGVQVTGFASGAILTTSVRWRFNQAPNAKDFGGSVITVLPGQHLMVAALGAPVNTNVSVVIAFDDMINQSARGSVAVV